ncbi:MAG: hypothetical protein V4568_08870 [Pseudomonadota bacterium]
MHIQPLSWSDGCKEIGRVNSELALIFQSISADPSIASNVYEGTPFIKASYSYGKPILVDGVFKSPCDCPKCHLLANQFSDRVPLGLVLQKSFEIIKKIEVTRRQKTINGIEPLRLLKTGEIFGVFETLDALLGRTPRPAPWNIYAGARTIEVASTANDGFLYHIDKFSSSNRSFYDDKDNTILNWWKLLQNLSSHWHLSWSADALLISPNLLMKIPPGSMSDLYLKYLYKVGYQQQEDLINDLPLTHNTGRLTDDAQIHNFRHILSIANGRKIAYRPATSDDSLGPFIEILRGLSEDLPRTDNYHFPFLLVPSYLEASESELDYGYHSVNHPCFGLGEKLAAGLDNIWYEIERQSKRQRENFPLNVNASNVFGADSNTTRYVDGYSDFLTQHFASDFAEQRKIAAAKKWKGIGMQQPSNDLKNRPLLDKGFFKAFARIVVAKN